MKGNYVKTSAEELTAIADELRAIGPFTEDQKFTFPSSTGTPDGTYDPMVTKLMPKFGSTTVIERNGVCESWVKFKRSDLPQHKHFQIKDTIRPNYNAYTTEGGYDNYLIYGLKPGLRHGEYDGSIYNDLNNYLEVTNNGYFTITTTAASRRVGTNSILDVFDSNGLPVESFHIILFGDIGGDGWIDNADAIAIENEVNGHTSWSNEYSPNYNKYLKIAGDITNDGYIYSFTVSEYEQYLTGYRFIDQFTGRARSIEGYPPKYDFFGLGFAEAYQELIDNFYQKVYHGTLTQEDVDGIIFEGEQLRLFQHTYGNSVSTYLGIKNITVAPSFLNSWGNCRRLHDIEVVNIINSDNQDITIKADKFGACYNLKTIKCSPIAVENSGFSGCRLLTLGNDSLQLDNCLTIGSQGFYGTSFEEISLLSCTSIGTHAFLRADTLTQLEKVYLPATPPDLSDVKAFQLFYYQGGQAIYEINPTLKFYVPNGAKAAYASATNWSGFIDGTFDGIDHFVELGGNS